jgi:hypothetical protein
MRGQRIAKLAAPMDDTYARRFLLLLLAGFLILTALNINGSSVALWSGILNERETVGALLFSHPREVRSDEWLVWTPSLLAQAKHQPAFPLENPALGAGRSPMLMNLPTRHYSTLFRPQLWGYFLFDIEHGYAWNWNMKIFGLLAAMFLLIRKLSDGSFWPALLGSAWIFCSSYIQWGFSCPPMLPEMLASWAFALWCVMKLCDSPPWKSAAALTAGLIVAAVNFALSMYPPYQIPVAYLGVAILAGWFWKRRTAIPPGARWFPEPRWLLLAVAGIALVVVPFFVQLLPTLHLVAHTSYPGARRSTGGALGVINLFFGLTEPFISATTFPERCASIADASNFFPIWPAAACWMATMLGKEKNLRLRLLWPLLICVLGFTLFAICPLPPIIGRITLLSFSTEVRLILPIGIGGILLSVLALREMEPAPRHPLVPRVILLALCGGAATALLAILSRESPVFFNPWRLASVIVFSWCLFALYLWPMKRLFSVILLAALFLPAIQVNPVTCGLAPLTETSALPIIEKIQRSDPGARWVAFDGAIQSALLMAAGVDVISGAKTLPDLDFYHDIDPDGRSLEIYNRYSLGLFHLAPKPEIVTFSLFNFCAHNLTIHPANPALRKRNVRYFVFLHPLKDPAAFDLQQFVAIPERHIFIYRFKEPIPAGA